MKPRRASPEGPVPPGGQQAPIITTTLEVRWILPGRVDAATVGWFTRLATATESRVDSYLLNPRLQDLSVKIRAGSQFDVKAFRGSPGVIEVAGGSMGRMGAWQKWSFPLGPESQPAPNSRAWRRVRKRRMIAWFGASGGPLTDTADQGAAQCAVELTDITVGDEPWWTLAFEASGPSSWRRRAVGNAATFAFAEPIPTDITLDLDNSVSYAQWLTRS